MKNPVKMTIQEATASYEAWLGKQIPLIAEDLEQKHELMKSAPFPFLQATCYRWAQLWPQVKKPVRQAREVLAIGDLHAESFGIWRDAEGRLVWGIYDFDEACRLPYTYDLVRLATSIRLAISSGRLDLEGRAADAAVLAGYKEGLEAGGRPVILSEHWEVLRRVALVKSDHPEKFWKKLNGLPVVPPDRIPAGAAEALGEMLPGGDLNLRYAHRVADLGSLGRQRYVALADWKGGKIAREAKAVAQASFFWAHRGEGNTRELYRTILGQAVRCPDPWVKVKRRWVVRRLAPDCSRLELADLPPEKEIAGFLHALGWETANVHLGSASSAALLVDLVSLPEGWLHDAVEEMLEGVLADWHSWKESAREKPVKKSASVKKKPAAKTRRKPAAKSIST